MTIRTKLVLLLTVPLLALLGVAGVAVVSAIDRSDTAAEAIDLADTAAGPGLVARALSEERAATVLYLRELIDRPELDAVRQRVDAALFAGASDLAAGTAEDQAIYAEALAAYEVLPQIRATVVDRTISQADAWAFYAGGIELVLDANRETRTDIDLPEIRTTLDRLDVIERAIDADAAVGAFLDAIAREGVGPSIEDRTTLQALATVRTLRLEDASVSTGDTEAIDEKIEEAFATAPGEPLDADTDLLAGALRGAQATLINASDQATDELIADARSVQSEAEQQQLIALIGAGIVVLLGLFFVLVASRSIGAPLRRLTREATDVADHRLPDAVAQVRSAPFGEDIELPELPPIAVGDDDEIGQVGGAIDRLQRVSLDLAVEQALLRHNVSDSLLNLARRTQSLVGRQLDALTVLEQEEADPEALERLFEIDHLATRIRRHAESLVVLAGSDSTRVRGPAASVGDVLRAALGEVEDYQRVEFGPVDAAVLHGHAVSDLAHLLAELLENGLNFSPPDQPVGIVGRRTEHMYRIAIVDCGVGLSEDDLERANARLAGEELPTVAPSRYLGHYVAARLARRLGATVRLSRAATGGVLADVLVPSSLIVSEAGVEEPDEPEVDGPASSSLLSSDVSSVMNVPPVPDPLPLDAALIDGYDDVAAAAVPHAERRDPVVEVREPEAAAAPPQRPLGELAQRRRGASLSPDDVAADAAPEQISQDESAGSSLGLTLPKRSAPPPDEAPAARIEPVLPESSGERPPAPEPPVDAAADSAALSSAFDAAVNGHDVVDHEPNGHVGTADGAEVARTSESADTSVDSSNEVAAEHANGAVADDDAEPMAAEPNAPAAEVAPAAPPSPTSLVPVAEDAAPVEPSTPESESESVASGLARRTRGANLPETGGRFDELKIDREALAERDADSVRDMLSRFSDGVQRGREGDSSPEQEQSDV
ncbi:MAG: ATP-binding protein [Actinomycetota bacterium]